jgi:hypothetical protein
VPAELSRGVGDGEEQWGARHGFRPHRPPRAQDECHEHQAAVGAAAERRNLAEDRPGAFPAKRDPLALA